MSADPRILQNGRGRPGGADAGAKTAPASMPPTLTNGSR